MNKRYLEFNGTIANIYKSLLKIKDKEMKSMDMKAAHVDIMSYLKFHKNGLSATELSDLCQIDKGQISRAIKDLEQRGFVEITDNGGKRAYGSKIILTEDGQKHASMVNHKIDKIVHSASAKLTKEERIKFYEVLMEISNNLTIIATGEGKAL